MANIHEKSLQDLEYYTVLQQISNYCITPLGADAVLAIKPWLKAENIKIELESVKEFSASFQGDNKIPNHGFDAITKELQLLGIENSSIELSGFRRIEKICETTKELLFFFKKYEEFYIQLQNYSSQLVYQPQIKAEIEGVIDRYGKIKDTASPLLQSIRKRLNIVKSQVNASFNRALSQYAQADYLDEIKESVVDNRRVLAIKAMHRKKVKGAVLGQSKTGSIVYIEPQETLQFANELSHLLFEESEEIKKIIKLLTLFLKPYAQVLNEYQEYLVAIDVWYAKAKYGVEINGVVPLINETNKLDLKNAYHPLLLISHKKQKKKTHPQSILLYPDNRIIVISGPNAGGKSITLKTVGLLQLMFQSGMLIPVDPYSEMCVFKKVLTDIGDNQSIENHLSTYSYRLKQMKYFLKKCDNKTLFLIDEFGTGTDPELGGALAETFLEVFYEQQSFGIITTHYSNLKLLANELPFATNANMQFDSKNLEPLFQLHTGEAGSSFTFEVAQKNGIPYHLINKAKKKIARGKIRFDKSIANLQKERLQLRNTTTSLKQEEQKAKEEAKQLEATQQKIKSKLESYQELYDANQKWIALGKKIDGLAERFFNNKKKKELFDEVLKLVLQENIKRKKVAIKQDKAEKIKKEAILKEVNKEVETIRAHKKAKKETAQIKPVSKKVLLKIGDRVRMIDGKAIGTIDQIEKEKATVNYGVFTTKVNLEALEKV